TRLLHMAGLSDLALKSHEFPNLEDSYFFGPSFIQEVKGRYKARRCFSELKKSFPGYKKTFWTEGSPCRSAGASREASHQAQYPHYSGKHKLPGGSRGAHSRGGPASKRTPMHSSKCASSHATKLEGYFFRQMGCKDFSKGFTTSPFKISSLEVCTRQRGEPSARCLPLPRFKSRENRVGRHVHYRMGKSVVPNLQIRWFLEAGSKCEVSERFQQKKKVQDGGFIRSSRLSTGKIFCNRYSQEKRHFLRFRWKGKVWQWTVMVFGLSNAPYTFFRMMKSVIAHVRLKGYMCLHYLDEILFMHPDGEAVASQMDYLASFLQDLGFVVNLQKSVLISTQSTVFLGFVLNTRTMSLGIPQDKWDKLL
ncbi:Hypothetical predicted protein, partial [Pelobates cultripes]